MTDQKQEISDIVQEMKAIARQLSKPDFANREAYEEAYRSRLAKVKSTNIEGTYVPLVVWYDAYFLSRAGIEPLAHQLRK